ncbi:hypothetical protein ACJ41O_008550 [Fusarium nematophilum]
MARTRSTKAAPAESKTSAEPKTTGSKFSLPPRSETPSQVFILPSKASPDARIVTLPNPRHARPARYLACPETGIYEFTKIAAPKTTPRSWLIETTLPKGADMEKDGEGVKAEVSMGQELYLATAIDPLFLVLPALTEAKSNRGSEDQKRLFLSSDDYFDKLPEEESHLSEILRCAKTRRVIERRMAEICDTVEAGDESMFRISEKKLVAVILEKAKRMSKGGLPASMEEKFVKKTLEAPILTQNREKTEVATVTSNAELETSTPVIESNDSQSTTASTEAGESQPSTAATSFTEETTTAEKIVTAIEASPEVIDLQRLRVAFSFICSSYIAPVLAAQLQELLLKETALVDFAPLDEYMSELTKLRAQAMAAHSMNDYSRKRGLDEEEDEARAKKRKLEEEKKKKSMESRGVRELKKVNTKGMKKMSDFFKKK